MLRTLLLLGLVSAPVLSALMLTAESVQSQTATESPAFPVPASLPADTKVQIDGSSSMSAINKALQDRFAQKFPTAKVTFANKTTNEALAALEKGEIDLAAIGRPLMPEETAKGLSQVPISREKIAIVIGADNPFTGNITFEQFAKIFRGEIKDWSELGGASGPIRFVDRPETSDTRLAFQRYPVFKKAPFKTGTTAQTITDDNTDVMVKELGKDGIGYAIASQVLNREGIRILSMHKTLPSDPRYPFSQPRGYVYKGTPNAAVSSFLGFATTPEGQEAVKIAESTAMVSPGTTAAENTTGATGGAAAPAMSGESGMPWWPLLLGIPLVGGLLLWALKGRDKDETLLAPVAGKGATGTVPPSQGGAVPFAGETGVAKPPQGGAIPFAGAAAGAVAGAAALGAGAAAVGAVRSIRKSRMILTPRDSGNAYAYWEATESDKAEARKQGGQKLALRIYDVSSLSTQAFQQYDLDEQATDRHVPIPVPDHDYRAELGYLAEGGRWIKVTQSNSIRIPSGPSGAGIGDTALRTGKEAAAKTSAGFGSVSSGVNDAIAGAGNAATEMGAKAAGMGSAGLGAAVGLGAAGVGAAAGIGATVAGLGQKMGVAATPNEATQIDLVEPSEVSQKMGVAATPNEATQIDLVDHPGACSIANLKVHSQHNCYVLDAKTMEQIQNKAVSQPLEPGDYLIKIQSGAFGYRSGAGIVGEPLVLLWIYGGKVINQKTKVEVGSTWSSLNGYDDLLTLHVREAATLSAFFFDTKVDDNQGEVTLSIVRV